MARVAIAAVVATVVDMAYGFLVYGTLLGSSFAAYPAIFRPADDTSHMGYLALGVLIAMFAAAFIYTKGYEGGSAVAEGLRFGCLLGTFMVGVNVINFGILNIGAGLTVRMAIAAFIEFLVIGVAIALVARPAAPSRRAATV